MEDIENYFQWGEYQQLILRLEPVIDSISRYSDSSHTARYCSYLGVAYYSLGQLENARNFFRNALSFDLNCQIDPTYITNEILDQFTLIKKEIETEHQLQYQQDSLAKKQIIYETALKNMTAETIVKRQKNDRIFAFILNGCGLYFCGVSIYEYFSTKEVYGNFKTAAHSGDLLTYNKYQPLMKRANFIIVASSSASAVCFLAGLNFTIKFLKTKKLQFE